LTRYCSHIARLYTLTPKFWVTQFGLLAFFSSLWHIHILLFLAMTFWVTLHSHKLQGKLSFIQNGVVSKKLWHFFSRNLKVPFHLNKELFHVALSHVSPLSHELPCFPILILSSLHLVIFRHPYLTYMKSNFRNF
jgi:hypothetical protein